MKTASVNWCIVAMILLSVGGSQAQDMKPAVPAVPEAVKNLMKFVGTWESNATLTAEGKTHTLLYKVECKPVADGNGVYAEEWFSDKELGTLKGSDLYGYDPYDSKVHIYSVDNMGTTHEHSGTWQTPDHLYAEHNSMRDGKKYVEKLDFMFTKSDELHFKMVATLDGKVVETGEGLFHKKP